MNNWQKLLSSSILISAINDFRITDAAIRKLKPEKRKLAKKARASAQKFFYPETAGGKKWLDLICEGAQVSAPYVLSHVKPRRGRKPTQQGKGCLPKGVVL